jgi:TIR domain/Sel1 repeat
MTDIFISYGHEDRPRAQVLAQMLEGQKWSIFWDRTIPIGKTWRETIGKELGNARCVIVLWSKTSIESGWVQEEADDAKRRGILVPVLIENVQPPIGFRSIQTADLVNWGATEPTEAFRRLIFDLAALIGAPPKEAERKANSPSGLANSPSDVADRQDREAAAARKGDAEARTNLEKAAANGDAVAMYRVGDLYENGYGVTQDYAKAREWYEKAAAKGGFGGYSATPSLSLLYSNGYGVAKNPAKALEWLEKGGDILTKMCAARPEAHCAPN